jgi:UDP-GlcNAc:undecaprenyl-phosphate GlcNAc-1-phosphate transferase
VVMSTLLSIIIPFAIVATATPIIRRFALHWKLGDKPNGRKIHTATIPHLGGVGIVAATLTMVAVAARWFDRTGATTDALIRFILPVGLVVVMGLVDDLKNLRPRQKLLMQVIAAAALALAGFHLVVGIPVLDGNAVFGILLSVFYLVGISSALNLVDGMDGLAAGLSLVSAAAFAVLGALLGAAPTLYMSLALGGACLGFLVHNFPPGKIFMGDNGSTFLGMMLGLIACSFTMLQPAISTFVAVCLILAVPMIDAWLAIARRLALRRPVFVADCQHIHHVLHSFGFTSRQTLFILYLLQSVMAFLGILTAKGLMVALVLGVSLMAVTFLSFLRIMLVTPERRRADRTQPVPAKLVHNSVPSLEK